MICKDTLSKKLLCLALAVLFLAIASSCGLQVLSASNTNKTLSLGSSQIDKDISALSTKKQTSEVPEGYRAVCDDGTGYLAVGTNGRIDRIKTDKTVTTVPSSTTVCLNGVVSMDDTEVAVGDAGVILFAKKGESFKRAKSGTDKSLYSVTKFRGAFWASGAEGILLHSSDGEHWTLIETETKNNILSISANEKMCMAVTRESQILMSTDGIKWNFTDYNTMYKGYSEPYWFRSIRACGDVFSIAGEYQKYPDFPAILSSDTGEVWREHALTKINGKPREESFPLTVNAVAVDWDQLVVACNGGKLLTVTECSVCNKLDGLSNQNINDLAWANGFLALVGDGFWFDVRRSDTFRQYSIRAEQALKDYSNGAYIVDVRTDDEYAQQHIKGSIHIPVDLVEAELEKEIPDKSKEVIFYCDKGVRAQQALEKALQMGYEKVYNLGGISDWPYDTEAGSIYGGN